MLYRDLKQDAIMNYSRSCVGFFLRNNGFSDDEILATLAICKSLFQNILSHVMYGKEKGKGFNIITNDHIEITVRKCDHRNYRVILCVLDQLNKCGQLDQCGQASLRLAQMYFLPLVYTYLFSYLLSKQYTDEEIVDKLIDDIECAIDLIFGKYEKDLVGRGISFDKDTFKKEMIRLLLNVVDDVDNKKLRTKLLDSVEKSKCCYLGTIKGLEEGISQDVMLQVFTSVVYKQIIEYFIDIHSHTLSQQFKDKVFSITSFFGSGVPNLLPKSCREYLGFQEELDIMGLCENLPSMFYGVDFSDPVSQRRNIDYMFYDMSVSLGELFDVVYAGDMSKHTIIERSSCFASYDIMLAFHEVTHPGKIDILVKLEYVLLLCHLSLAINVKNLDSSVMEGDFHMLTRIAKLRELANASKYKCSDGLWKTGMEFFYELLSLCYYAAFCSKVLIADVVACYDKHCDRLCSFAEARGEECEKLQEFYIEDFQRDKERFKCGDVDLFKIDLNPSLLWVLIRHLVAGVSQQLNPELLQMSYAIFRECRPVNEVKAQQAALMLLKAFQGSGGIKKGVAHGMVMKLLFGNFLERNLMLKFCDVMYIAYCNAPNGNLKEALIRDFVNWGKTILDFLAHMDSELSIDYSEQAVELLSLKNYITYSKISLTIDSYAGSVDINGEDLERQRNERFELGFINVLSRMAKHDVADAIKVSPCNGLSQKACESVMQLCSSYVYSHDESTVGECLLSARLYSVNFLFFNVLTYPGLANDFASLYCDSSLENSDAIQTKFTTILEGFSKSVEEGKTYSSGAVFGDTSFLSKMFGFARSNTKNSAVDDFIKTSLITKDSVIYLDYGVLESVYLNIVKVRNLSYSLSIEEVSSAYAEPKNFYFTSALLLRIFCNNHQIKMLGLYGGFSDRNHNYVALPSSNDQGKLSTPTRTRVISIEDYQAEPGPSSINPEVQEEVTYRDGQSGNFAASDQTDSSNARDIKDAHDDKQMQSGDLETGSEDQTKHSGERPGDINAKGQEEVTYNDGQGSSASSSSQAYSKGEAVVELSLQEETSGVSIGEQRKTTHYDAQDSDLPTSSNGQVNEHSRERPGDIHAKKHEEVTGHGEQGSNLTFNSRVTDGLPSRRQCYSYAATSVLMLSVTAVLLTLIFTHQLSNFSMGGISGAACCFILSLVFCGIALKKSNFEENNQSILETSDEEILTQEAQIIQVNPTSTKVH